MGDGPRSVAAANLNGDASTDLAVVNLLSHNVTILLGDGSGNFTPVPATSPEAVGMNPSSVAAANFNGDASTDLAVANQTSGSVTILLGNGAGDFTEVPATSPETAGLTPRSIAAANLGGDASTDLAVVNLDSDNVTILLGNGAGDFTAPGTSPEAVGGAPAAVAAANLNGDASSDLAVVNGNDDNVTILLGDGSGEFTAAGSSPETAGDGPAAVAAANLGGDAQQRPRGRERRRPQRHDPARRARPAGDHSGRSPRLDPAHQEEVQEGPEAEEGEVREERRRRRRIDTLAGSRFLGRPLASPPTCSSRRPGLEPSATGDVRAG